MPSEAARLQRPPSPNDPPMRFLATLALLLTLACLTAQTAQVEFGKNRVQYHRDFAEWEKYESDNFITYWYGTGRNIGQSVVQMAEYDFGYIQKMLEHRVNQKVQLIVYRDVTDLKQSNIGSEEVFNLPNTQGLGQSTTYISQTQTKFLGNKAFVYFNGDHSDLRRQVREAMASVYLENMLYGSSVQEVVQNAVLLNLPPWFKDGLIAYLGEDWNTRKDDQLRQLLTGGEYETFQDLATDYPRLAGHAFWYFVAENYGKPTVSNLLYVTRTDRSVERAFLYILGGNYENILYNWGEFYRNRYKADLEGRAVPDGEIIPVKNKRRAPITNVRVSPDGTKVAYVLNEIGKYKVYLHDLRTGEREMIHKGGQRNLLQATDYSYPLLAFNPSGQELAVLFEFRDQPKLLQHPLNGGKPIVKPVDPELDRVHNIAYLDPATLVMSASDLGYSDIYKYVIQTQVAIRITNDHWDDLDVVPVTIRGRKGLLWSSNRPGNTFRTEKLDTILPIDNFDLFYYNLETASPELVRVTDTPLADERQPIAVDGKFFGYLSNVSGINNRHLGYLEDYIDHYDQTLYFATGDSLTLNADSTFNNVDSLEITDRRVFPVIKERGVTRPVTDFATNINLQASTGRNYQGVQVFVADAGQAIRRVTLDTNQVARLAPTGYRRRSYQERGQAFPAFTNPGQGRTDGLIGPNQRAPGEATPEPAAPDIEEGMLFQTRFEDFVKPPTPQEDAERENILLREPETTEVDPTRPAETASPTPPAGDSTGVRPNLTVVSPPVNRRAPRSARRRLLGERPVAELNRIYRFQPGRITPYRLTFRVNYVKTEADNDPLFSGLNAFSANPDGYTQQPLGILFKSNVIDLFEDYSITGGVRIPTRFNGTEYFVTFEDRKRRLDRIFSVYRRNRRVEEGSFTLLRQGPARLIEENTLLAQYGVRYPLDVFRSLRATATIRRDRVQTLPTEIAALRESPQNQARAGMRLEYVFDNTLNLATNLRMGTRYKVYTDFYKGFDVSFSSGGDDTGLEDGFLGVVGFDARHYQRLDKRSILALRFAGATNFGRQRILYYLGGADNMLSTNFNEGIPTPTNGNFVFQDLANPLRGFDINVRNGGTYLLGNAELRVPVFNYLFRNLRSKFLRDFQLVSFFDVGSAWSGSDPFDEDNPVNLTTYESPAVTIRVRRFREPIVYGYGVGARTSIFGYFIRADYAWGVETDIAQKPKLHVSLGLDF